MCGATNCAGVSSSTSTKHNFIRTSSVPGFVSNRITVLESAQQEEQNLLCSRDCLFRFFFGHLWNFSRCVAHKLVFFGLVLGVLLSNRIAIAPCSERSFTDDALHHSIFVILVARKTSSPSLFYCAAITITPSACRAPSRTEQDHLINDISWHPDPQFLSHYLSFSVYIFHHLHLLCTLLKEHLNPTLFRS